MPVITAITCLCYNMSGWRTFVKVCKTAPKSDMLVMVTTFVLMAFDLVVDIRVGMVLVCILFVKRIAGETAVRAWVDADQMETDSGIEVPLFIRACLNWRGRCFRRLDKLTHNLFMNDCKVY